MKDKIVSYGKLPRKPIHGSDAEERCVLLAFEYRSFEFGILRLLLDIIIIIIIIIIIMTKLCGKKKVDGENFQKIPIHW